MYRHAWAVLNMNNEIKIFTYHRVVWGGGKLNRIYGDVAFVLHCGV